MVQEKLKDAPPHRQLVSWAASCLEDDIKSAEEIVSTAYSLVLKLKTANGVYYLKRVPQALFIEATTLDLLARACNVDAAPRLIAQNPALRSFITNSCGDETLRTFFKGGLDRELLRTGVACYMHIQSATAPHVQQFLDAGAPDWRLDKLPQLYDAMLDDTDFVRFLELAVADILGLRRRGDALARLCRELAAYKIPDTVNHCDFQDNNILIDHASAHMTIIDWGEIYVGNPLLSRHHCLMSASYVYKLDKANDDFRFLEKHFLDVPEKDFVHIRAILDQLYPLHYTLVWQQLVNATGSGFPRKRELVRKTLLSFGEG